MEDAGKWIEFAALIAAGWYVCRRLGGVTIEAIALRRRLSAIRGIASTVVKDV